MEWGGSDTVYPVNIRIEVWDRIGLIHDITSVLAEEKINITSVNSIHHDDHTVTEYFTIETKDLAQLSRVLAKIDGVRGVINVSRVGE